VIEVMLYTKPGCHLCESVEQVIHRAKKTRHFLLALRDITENPDDFSRYEAEIPVVTLNGKEVARHRMNLAEFVAALDAAV
jgi:hypothetical protein